MGRLAKALYPKDNPQALSLLKLCAIGVGRRLARNSGAMGVEIICLVKILSDSEIPYREIFVSLKRGLMHIANCHQNTDTCSYINIFV